MEYIKLLDSEDFHDTEISDDSSFTLKAHMVFLSRFPEFAACMCSSVDTKNKIVKFVVKREITRYINLLC